MTEKGRGMQVWARPPGLGGVGNEGIEAQSGGEGGWDGELEIGG